MTPATPINHLLLHIADRRKKKQQRGRSSTRTELTAGMLIRAWAPPVGSHRHVSRLRARKGDSPIYLTNGAWRAFRAVCRPWCGTNRAQIQQHAHCRRGLEPEHEQRKHYIIARQRQRQSNKGGLSGTVRDCPVVSCCRPLQASYVVGG